jgi:hypothetical protein
VTISHPLLLEWADRDSGWTHYYAKGNSMTRDMSDKNQRSPHHESTGRPRHPSGLALGLRAMLLAGLLITALPQVAAASNSIVFGDATTSTSPTGAELIEVDMGLNLADVTSGGGIGVEYDETRLEFVSFRFDKAGPPNFTSAPIDGSQAQPLAIGGGWATLTPPFGVSGIQPFGTLTFRVISDGNATISAIDGIAPFGPFAGATGTLAMMDASMTINVGAPISALPAVPALGSQWVLIMMVGFVMVIFGVLSLSSSHAKASI